MKLERKKLKTKNPEKKNLEKENPEKVYTLSRKIREENLVKAKEYEKLSLPFPSICLFAILLDIIIPETANQTDCCEI